VSTNCPTPNLVGELEIGCRRVAAELIQLGHLLPPLLNYDPFSIAGLYRKELLSSYLVYKLKIKIKKKNKIKVIGMRRTI